MLGRLTKFIFGLVSVLATLTVRIFLLVDPNDYRTEHEKKTLSNFGLNVSIKGNLSWSFWPLGLSVEDLEIYDQQGAVFTTLASTQLSIDTLSILRLSPIINGLYSSGAQVKPNVDEYGRANWKNLIEVSEKPSHTKVSTQPSDDANQTHAPKPETQQTSSPAAVPPVLGLFVQHIHLEDYTIEYTDESNGQRFIMAPLNLDITNAGLGKHFPLNLSFKVIDKVNAFSYQHALSGQVLISKDLQSISLSELENNIDLVGLLSKHPLKFSLTGAVSYSIKKDHLKATAIQLSGAGLAIDTNFQVDKLSTELSINGDISIAPFALATVNRHLGLDLGVNKQAFNAVSLVAPFSFKRGWIRANNFDLHIDDTQLIGNIVASPSNNDYDITLHGNTLNLQPYLAAIERPTTTPPSITTQHTHRIAAIDSKAKPTTNTELLPIQAISELILKADLHLDALLYAGYRFDNIKLGLEISDQVVDLHTASAQFLDGNIETQATIKTRNQPVLWQATGALSGLNLETLAAIQGLEDTGFMPTGTVDATYTVKAEGNTATELISHNQGAAHTQVHNGVITGINADELICQGYALANGESLSNTVTTKLTAFSHLGASHALNDGQLHTSDLLIRTDSLSLSGDGDFNLAPLEYNYQIALTPRSSNIDTACRINQRLRALSIPLICSGNVKQSQHQCTIDRQRLISEVTALAKSEAKRKTKKEVNRALDKQLDKLDRYIDKDSEAVQKLKKGLLNLFQ